MEDNWTRYGRKKREAYLKAAAALYGNGVAPSPDTYLAKIAVRGETERRAQQRLVLWMKDRDIPFYAIPNGSKRDVHMTQALLSEGMQPGAPDLCLTRARRGFHGLYIEMKRDDGGAGLSHKQKKWLELLTSEGYCAVQCNGFEAAKNKIEWYLS